MKATSILGSSIGKTPVITTLVATVVWVHPAIASTMATQIQNQTEQRALVFEIEQKEKLQMHVGTGTSEEQANTALEKSLRAYLEKKRSPLAECTEIILQQKNWKKILSLSNAESGMGRAYPRAKVNLWGVGGSNLWDFGDTVCEAVPKMNDFLANYPKRSTVKYQDMSIEKMNGLYKQPAAMHWVKNNNVILNDLDKLELEANQNTEVAFVANK